MKTQHTSGEWKITPFENRGYLILCNNEPLAHVKHIHEDVEDKANAKLIAAAPELLEALKEISKGEGRYDMDKLIHASNTIEDMKNIAKEAIKKATE